MTKTKNNLLQKKIVVLPQGTASLQAGTWGGTAIFCNCF